MQPQQQETALDASASKLESLPTFEHSCRELYRDLANQNIPQALTLREWLDLAEAWRIRQVLSECKGNRSAAARALGIGRRTLYSKMERLQITPNASRGNTAQLSPAV